MATSTGLLTSALVGVIATILTTTLSFATPITYTEQATATGALGEKGFNAATILLTMSNDTTNVTLASPGIFHNMGILTLNIPGFTPVTFTDTILAVANQEIPSAGFGDVSNNRAILFTSNALFSTYDLKTSIGPILGPATLNPGQPFPTSGGTFVLNNVVGNVTYTATTSTPEVASLMLLSIGLTALGVIQRRKFLTKAATGGYLLSAFCP